MKPENALFFWFVTSKESWGGLRKSSVSKPTKPGNSEQIHRVVCLTYAEERYARMGTPGAWTKSWGRPPGPCGKESYARLSYAAHPVATVGPESDASSCAALSIHRACMLTHFERSRPAKHPSLI
jgi:hypothetical protein